MNSLSRPKVGALVRARRRQLHMTLQELGAAAAVSVGYLSQLERDLATPSLGTLTQVARALDVGIDYFIATPRASDALTRAAERESFSVDGSSIRYERLGAEFPGNVLSSFILTIPPGYRSETVHHEGEEIIFVLDGEMTQRIDGHEMLIRAGDSLHFRGNSPHSWSNDSSKPAKVLWTGTLTMFRSRAGRSAFRSPKLEANEKTIEPKKTKERPS
jgi:transcriptional regulator with XRE-family HTH domain